MNYVKKLRSSAQLSDINTTEYRCIWPLRLIFMKTTVTSQRGEGRADLFQLLFLPGNHRGLQDEIDLRDQSREGEKA